MENIILKSIFLGGPFLFLLYAYICMCENRPMFRKRCSECGKKDRNWSPVPVGYDDFGWQHNCGDEK